MYDSTRPNKNSLDLSSSSGAANGRVVFCADHHFPMALAVALISSEMPFEHLLQGLDSFPRGCVIPRRHGYEPHEAYAATEGGRDAQDEVHGVGGMHGPDSAGGNGGPLAAATGPGSRGRGGPRHGRPHQPAPCLL